MLAHLAFLRRGFSFIGTVAQAGRTTARIQKYLRVYSTSTRTRSFTICIVHIREPKHLLYHLFGQS